MMKRKNKNSQRNSRRFFLTFFGFFLFLFSALLVQGRCPQRTGPVDILPGDVCSFCGMHITEKKFSGQYITSDGKVKKFDDIGCLVSSYIKEKEKVKKIWVADFETGEWLDSENALFSSGFTTPMHYGFVAFKKQNCKGDCIPFEDLVKKIVETHNEE